MHPLDLDQLTVCEARADGTVKLMVAIADVDALVSKETPIDDHAHLNTTSVYTSARIFPMLPERLSTDLTSLNAGEDRLALVSEMVFSAEGALATSTVYRAMVRNKAKLAYDAVAAWIEGEGTLPAAAAAVPGMEAQLRTQDALSLVIIKLMGSGEYVVEAPGAEPVGHFGLSVRDYTHSTAPNRRFPDLITSRLLKAALAGKPSPYANAELAELALHCTRQEDAAQKVERQMRKSEAGLVLESHVGQRFEGLVTGSTPSGVWVRIFSPPAEGKLVAGDEGLQVGEKVHVKLQRTDVERGFIDFVRVE